MPNVHEKHVASGFHMPVFGIGTWQMGGKWDRDPLNDDTADIRAIRAAIDLGVTCIDTADLYANGHTEELVGNAIRAVPRQSLFLISKVRESRMAYSDVLRACEGSLRRLGVSYLDLYILHTRSPRVPLEDTVRALDRLVDERLVLNIGVANFGVTSLRQAQRCANHPVVYDQVHYNLTCREAERSGLLAYCQAHDVLLAGWRPLQRGALLTDPPSLMRELCEKYAKTPAQIAINWLVSQPNVVTLTKTSDVTHLNENLGGVGWQMEASDIERLRREYPGQNAVSDSMPFA